MTEKWVVVVKLDGETAKGEVYNNFVTGEDVTFTDLEAAEKFAAKIEGEGRRMQATVEP